ncbi:site-specific integrase [Sphingobium sp. D43FB]|uniref:site-specific integrase n=1 Tax=Sphingobium sp. D43FB TaxID=2017595 RepID=UPI0020D054DC|nr:site-specific integrase [Sphingobium sp. D43FB]
MSNITRRVKMCEEDHCRWFLDPGSLAPWIDRFGAELADRRYSRLTILGYTDAARHFAAWVNSTSTPIQMVDADLLRRFADHRCECPGGRRWSRISPKYFRRAKRFYTFLQDIAVAPAPASLPLAPVHPLLDDYQRWLRIHRGLSERTIARHRRLLTNLLPTLGEATRDYNAGLIRSVVREWRERTGPADLRTITSALRSYLRFLAAAGLCRPNLDHAISPVVQWRLSSLPRYLSANDVERVVASCDQLSNGRLRDRAIQLLLARLGLRAGDVTALKLQDLDWATGMLQVSGNRPSASSFEHRAFFCATSSHMPRSGATAISCKRAYRSGRFLRRLRSNVGTACWRYVVSRSRIVARTDWIDQATHIQHPVWTDRGNRHARFGVDLPSPC